jgi:transglutaminase-like putative cysteine protease
MGLGSPGGASPEIGRMSSIPAVASPPVQAIQANRPDIKYLKIPGGERGTVATLKLMKQLVFGPWGSRHPDIVLLSNRIRDSLPSKDYRAEADAIFRYVKGHIRYKLDPQGLEWIQTPTYTAFVRKSGDCDDHSILTASLASAAGFRTAFRTVRGDPRSKSWTHVYPVIGITRRGKTEWLAADSTQKQSRLGWNPPEGKTYGMATWVLDPNMMEEDQQWH